tara:strand:+ start:88 stop:588 length:501 start_codon:yes stop_codon:yes gene_type:complete
MKESYYQRNKEKLKKKQKEYHEKNKSVQNEKNKVRNKENYEKYQVANAKWREDNKEHHKLKRAEYMREFRKTNPDYILKENVSHYIRRVLNGGKSGSYKKYLGCNIKEYKVYLENKFTDKMSWDNYGTYWEIDHIIPTSKGGSFYYTNTQPLSVKENRIKGNRYNG